MGGDVDDVGNDYLQELTSSKRKGKNLLSSVGNKVAGAGRVIKNLGRSQTKKDLTKGGILTVSNLGIRRDIMTKTPSYGLEARFTVGHSIEAIKVTKIAQTNLISDVLDLDVVDANGQLDIILYKVQLYRKQRIGSTFIPLENIIKQMNSSMEQEISVPYKGMNFMIKMKLHYSELEPQGDTRSPKKVIQTRSFHDSNNNQEVETNANTAEDSTENEKI